MLRPFDYFIITIFPSLLLSQFYIFHTVQFLSLYLFWRETNFKVNQTFFFFFFFYTTWKKLSLFPFPSIFVDIFLLFFISRWCNLFHLLKYLKHDQINRKIHWGNNTFLNERPGRFSSIASFYLILVSVLEILFKFSIVSRANKFSDKDELFYCVFITIAEIQAWSSILFLPIFVSHFTLFRSIRFVSVLLFLYCTQDE